MRFAVLRITLAVGGLIGLASATGPDIVAEGKPLVAELANPKYATSRCMLTPVLADDGRVVAKSGDPSFVAGDTFIAVGDERLDDTSKTALVDILERRPPDGQIRVRLQRAGSEHVVTAHCTDVKPFYTALREGAEAAVANDGGGCADKLAAAARLHGLSSIWLRLSMSCSIRAGRLSGARMWRTDYDLYRQRILETQYTPAALAGIRHGVLGAVRDLRQSGNPVLADELEKQYAAAVAGSDDNP